MTGLSHASPLSHVMSSPDVVIGIAEVGSSAVSALLSSHTSLSLPAACTRSFSHIRSLHRKATTRGVPVVPRPRAPFSSVQGRLSSLHPSVVAAFSYRTERLGCRSFTSRPALPDNPDPSSTSSPPPARLPADFNGSSVQGVANPRLFQPPSFISDAAHHLSPEQHQHLSLRLNTLHSQTGTQLAVVTVRSIALSDADGSGGVRGWAVRLFNQWGVGRRPENDGILVLLVEKQRRIEVVLGDGCQRQYGVSNSVIQRVVDERLVPWLKQGEFGMGLVEGVSALEQLVRQSHQGKPVAGETTLLTEQKPGTEGSVGSGGGGDVGGSGKGDDTGWGGGGASGRSSFNPRFMRGLLAVVAGFIALRVLTGPSAPYSTSSSSQPSRCSRCQGKLKLVGIIDRSNLLSTAGLDPSALQSIDRPDAPSSTPSPSFSSFPSDYDNSPFTVTDRNLYLADYRVDYQHALDSLSTQQAERLTQPGVQYQVYVCPDCSALYLQEGETEARRPLADTGDRLFDRTPFVGVGGGRLGGVGGGAVGGGMAAPGGSSRQPEVVWLPPAERHLKGVRRESDMSTSTGSAGGGFGGGSSAGGGAGASF